ncbi:MAG: 50S ribosomal protein L32 [Clostridiales bacterium]|nr:50S ribosomal protein L32 [Clostridiales bacterium]
MAVPKRRTSKAKKSSRKSVNMAKSAPALSTCSKCHEPKIPHRVCPNCGHYDGREIIAEEE